MKLGFKARINFTVALLVACSLTVLGIVNIYSLKTHMTTSLASATTEKLSYHANEVEYWMAAKYNHIEKGAAHFSPQLDEEANLRLVRLLAESTNMTNVAVAYSDGRTFAAHGGQDGVFEVSDYFIQRDWYQNTQRLQRTLISDPYIDIVTNEYVVSISAPLHHDGRFAGVIIGDIQLDEVTEQISQVQFAGGAATLVDHNNVFIASDDPDDIGLTPSQVEPSWRFIEDAFSQQNTGILDIYYLETDFLGYFERVVLADGTHWTIMVFIDEGTVLGSVQEVTHSAIFTIIVLTLVVSTLVITILNRIYQPLLKLKFAVQDLASGNGDLTQRLTVSGDDDLAQIGEGFNQFVSNIQYMMQQVTQSTVEISSSIEQLGQSAKQSEQQLQMHSAETEQIVSAISQMNEAAGSVAQNVDKSTQITRCASKEAEKSQEVVDSAVSTVTSLMSEFDEMSSNIDTMNNDANQISAVLSVIGEIADQTNLLALNAAIEAARAGEQGRGFAVVADEVRALAGRTQQSTSEIGEMLNKLLSGTENVVGAMEKTRLRCQSAADNTSDVNVSLGAMNGAVIDIEQLSVQISTAAEEQSVVTQEVSNNMLAIRDIVEGLLNGGQQTVRATDDLSEANRALNSLVSKFKIS